MRMRWWYLFSLVLVRWAALGPGPSFTQAAKQPLPEASSEELRAELYKNAVSLRSRRSSSVSEEQKAAELLIGATGFSSQQHGSAFPFNGTLPCRLPGSVRCTARLESTSLPGFEDSVNISRRAHRGALRELAKAFQDGSGVGQDMRLALALFRAAAAAGDPEAHGHMALCFSMGLDGPECWSAEGITGFGEPKPAEALLHYYFGALGGDPTSRMALGYRHLFGLGVPRSCWSAAAYYQPVGEQVSDLAAGVYHALPPPPAEPVKPNPNTPPVNRNPTWENPAVLILTHPDISESGPSSSGGSSSSSESSSPGGSSRAGSGRGSGGGSFPTPEGGLPYVERIRLHTQAAGGGPRSERHREVVQYYQYSADRGNTDAQTAVGQVFNYGTHGVDRDHTAALAYFKLAAEAGDTDAMAHLGAMYANGYGTTQSYEEALYWWRKAAPNGLALFGLGYAHLVGAGVERNEDSAFGYMTKAAEQLNSDARPDALFYLGVMHLRGLGVKRKNVPRALTYFTMAASMGHALAQYNAASMNLGGRGTSRNCKPAVTMLKALAERGPVAGAVQLGHEAFFRGRSGSALLSYLRAADAGIELAQANAAWMLERGYVPGPAAAALAFSLYQQSAAQSSVHSLLAMGDAYFYGRGVQQDWVRAAAVYYEAYQERSPEAMFNLGFMHEFGVGVPKDLALARRFYNMAKHTHGPAIVPVFIANMWLRAHDGWELVRPHLPAALNPLWNSIFTLSPPHTSLFGPWVQRAQDLLPNLALFQAEVLFWRWMDATGLGSLARLEDASEGATLLGLMVGLALVLRLRRRRAAAREVQQQEAARALQAQLAAQMAAGQAAAVRVPFTVPLNAARRAGGTAGQAGGAVGVGSGGGAGANGAAVDGAREEQRVGQGESVGERGAAAGLAATRDGEDQPANA